MKISDLIKELAERLGEEGDLEVKVPERYASGGCCCCGTDYYEDLETPSISIEGHADNRLLVLRP